MNEHPTSSGSAIDATEIACGTTVDALAVRIPEGSSLALSRVCLPPGGRTGVHRHDGPLLVIVESGVLTHHAPVHPDGVRGYVAGEAFLEGAEYLHDGVNDGADDVVLWMLAIRPTSCEADGVDQA